MAEAAAAATTAAATGDSGAAATTTTAAAATTGQAPVSTDWTSSLNDDMKGYVQSKGFKDPVAVLESYRNFEKTIGAPAEHLIKLPQDMNSPEGRAVWEKLGAPKDAKEYKIEIPAEHGGEEVANFIRETAHKNGWNHKQVENLVTGWNERNGKALEASKAAQETEIKAAQSNLEKEWGAALEQNTNIADAAAIKLGLGEKEIMALGSALGRDKALMLLHNLGKATGEANFVTGKQGGGEVLPPAYAQQRIKDLLGDASFQKRFKSGDADAVRDWNKLHEQAWGVGARAQ